MSERKQQPYAVFKNLSDVSWVGRYKHIYIYTVVSIRYLYIYIYLYVNHIYIYQLYHFLWCAVSVSMCVSDARVTKLLSTGGWRLNSDSAGGGDFSGGNHNPLEDLLCQN